MHKPIKYAEKGLSYAAGAAWGVFSTLNRIKPAPSFVPRWSDKPLLKSHEKTKPPLGWPRETDSLCPRCVPEIRQQILDGKLPVEILRNEKVGEIKAQIIERDGQILMVKDCPKHGHFEDLMAIDTAFYPHLEETFPGRDIRAQTTSSHNHGTCTIKYGRGAVLTVDLTNRCNMMCNPCFMDANQVGYVHELSWDDVKKILDNAVNVKPRRQMSVQFSGGEPTLSPYFLDAVAYARKVGFQSVQAATNGIRFAQDIDFARQAKASRPAPRLPAVRRGRQRGEQPPRRRQSLRRQAAGHREPPRRRRRRHPGHHHRQRPQQRPGRARHPVRDGQPREDQRSVPSSRSPSPDATRRSTTSRASPSATRSRTWRTT